MKLIGSRPLLNGGFVIGSQFSEHFAVLQYCEYELCPSSGTIFVTLSSDHSTILLRLCSKSIHIQSGFFENCV